MVAQPWRVRAFYQALQFFQVLAIQAVGRTEIHGDAMLHDAVLLEDLIEHFERPAAVDHKILGNNLEPVDRRLLAEDVAIMRDAQTDPDSVIAESVERI